MPVELRERSPQRVEHMAKVGQRLGLGGVRPQQKGHVLPWLCAVPVQQEEGQQRLGAARLQRNRSLVAPTQQERPEQLDRQHRVAHTSEP
jgi:hypothetical protein